MVEGRTEKALIPTLRCFLASRLSGQMPRLDPVPYHGRLPKEHELRRDVRLLLRGKNAADHVIALTDVYTGTSDFVDATDAKAKMRGWVGSEVRFHPHVALHEFEAWLLPYWPRMQTLSGSNRAQPRGNPENLNHNKPPADHLRELFRTGSRRTRYVKGRDAVRILESQDHLTAANACPELKAFLNTILTLAGGTAL
jgi:hypothetical protein